MSERKVLNKYYPPDFDPSKIPRAKLPKNRKFCVRLMAPCNMRCDTCGEYIYKGKKFNARKEDVEDQTYLGLRIYRFYIKCTRCLAEISFRTDLENTDYIIEAGATRNFMALKLAEEAAAKEEKERLEDEASNPMKLLESRTKASRQEIDVIEALEELKELNKRQAKVDFPGLLDKFDRLREQEKEREEQEDEEFVQSIFGQDSVRTIDSESSSDDERLTMNAASSATLASSSSHSGNEPTNILISKVPEPKVNKPSWAKRSIGSLSTSVDLSNLVRTKKRQKRNEDNINDDSDSNNKSGESSSNGDLGEPSSAPATSTISSGKSNALSMLGVYSGSDDSDS